MLKEDNNNIGSTTPKNRVEPVFFGSPSLYNQPSKNSKQPSNPDWDQPPPAYSSALNEPRSSTVSATPSAPPLENTGGYHPHQQNDSCRPQEAYPPQGYNQYGSIPNATSDTNIPSWPWISPPSATRPTEGEYRNHSTAETPTKKKIKHGCQASIQYFFYFFCICLVIRLIDLSSDGVPFADSCTHGVAWNSLPKRIEFDDGFFVRTVGGHLTSGQITIKSMDEEKQDINVGFVQATALISPSSLAHNTDLSFTIWYLNNSTILEIHVPQDLSSRSCVSLNVVIHVPAKTEFISVDTQNSLIEVLDERLQVDDLRLKTTNQAINFYSAWQGESLILSNKNAHIELNQPIIGSQSVSIKTTNGGVRVHRGIEAPELIYLSTENAAIDINSTLSSQQVIALYTTNGDINLYNVSASTSEIRTSNSNIKVEHAYVTNALDIRTTNGFLKMNMEQGQHAEISLHSTNGDVTSTLPTDFEGTFEFDTGSSGKMTISDELDWIHIQSICKSHMSGTRFKPGTINYNVSVGRLKVITTNAEANVVFGKPQAL